MKKKRRSKKGGRSLLEECSEDISLYEPADRAEELLCTETERDCISEGEEDDSNIISRVILF